jgi:hypothetical protein
MEPVNPSGLKITSQLEMKKKKKELRRIKE